MTPSRSDSECSWRLGGQFLIEAKSEDEATRALGAIERTAAKVAGSVTIHVHYSGPADEEC